MKRNTLILSAAVVGLSALIATASFAHGPKGGGGFGQGFMNGGGYGMMNGQGPGQGHGYGQGMMNGQGGPGFMQGNGFGDCQNGAQSLDTPLTIEDVTKNLTQRLEQRGNDRLKVGSVTETDDTITAQIVTVDNSLVRTIEIDKTTGRHVPVN